MNKKYCFVAIGVVAVILVVALAIAGVSKDDASKKEPEVVSDEATLQAQEGSYKLKITRVLEADPNPKEDTDAPDAKSVAIVVYEYTNDDIAHGLVIGSTHFKAYDKRGRELEQYPQKDLFEPSDVGASGTFTASVAFALNNDDDYLKIEYYKDISAKKPDVVFEQEW